MQYVTGKWFVDVQYTYSTVLTPKHQDFQKNLEVYTHNTGLLIECNYEEIGNRKVVNDPESGNLKVTCYRSISGKKK